MESVASDVNESVNKFQRQARLISIEQELQISVGLVQPDRHFIEDLFLLGFIRKDRNDKNRKYQNLKLYIFNDQILFAVDGVYLDMVRYFLIISRSCLAMIVF